MQTRLIPHSLVPAIATMGACLPVDAASPTLSCAVGAIGSFVLGRSASQILFDKNSPGFRFPFKLAGIDLGEAFESTSAVQPKAMILNLSMGTVLLTASLASLGLTDSVYQFASCMASSTLMGSGLSLITSIKENEPASTYAKKAVLGLSGTTGGFSALLATYLASAILK